MNYFVIPFIVIIVALLGSRFTNQGMEWYTKLKLPKFTPKPGIISLIWTIIFILLALSLLIFWNGLAHRGGFWAFILLFIVNGFSNVMWSFLFFKYRLIKLAWYDSLFLLLSAWALIGLSWPLSRAAAYLLIPYGLWLIFAAYLNYAVMKLNKE